MELTDEEKVNLLSLLLTPSSREERTMFFIYPHTVRESVRQLLYDNLHELEWGKTEMSEVVTPSYNEPAYQCEFNITWRGLTLLTVTLTYRTYNTSSKHVTVRIFCHAKKHRIILQKSTEDKGEWEEHQTVIFSLTVYYDKDHFINGEGELERRIFCNPEAILTAIRKGLSSVLEEIYTAQPLINPKFVISYT